MSNEVIDVKQLPKETVAKFVSDAAKMEIDSYSLKKLANDIRTDVNNKTATDSNKLLALQVRLDEQNKKYISLDNKAKTKPDSTWGCLPFALLPIIFALLLLICSLIYRNIYGNWLPDEYILTLLFITILINTTITIVANKIGSKKEMKQRRDAANEAKEQLCNSQKEYDASLKSCSNRKRTIDALAKHADLLEAKAAEIDTALQKHYSLGIIPPDYRDMIRVLYMDRAFRNDQVDTMREATLICDRDIHHREVIDSLHEIASAIQGLSSVLEDISYKISIMNAELKSIADGQDKLVSETESARYATEAVQKSQENIVWYERQKWFRDNYK